MGLILHIETSTTVCSVALARDEKLLSLKEENKGFSHAENITLFIHGVLKIAGKKIGEIDAVAVSGGPGSYTGLRIGVSTAKGLCYALEKPLIAISTLKSLATGFVDSFIRAQDPGEVSSINPGYPFPGERGVLSDNASHKVLPFGKDLGWVLIPMIDARRMEVYCAVYDEQLNEIEKDSAKIIDENSFSAFLNEKKAYFFGDGSEKCKTILAHQPNAIFIDHIFPSAASMIFLAEEKFQKKEFEDVSLFEPFYLKEFHHGKK